MESLCVFCGSSSGYHPIYEKAAHDLGKRLAEENLTLVYGGGSVGLMGVLANSVMEHGGKVIGIIPKFLYDLEVGLDSITQLIIVESMHERKQKMAELANGFIAMPGGIGTLEELFEIFTWAQLALIRKPVAILDINGFYEYMIRHLQRMVKEGFLKAENLDALVISQNIHELIMKIQAYNYTETPKWVEKT